MKKLFILGLLCAHALRALSIDTDDILKYGLHAVVSPWVNSEMSLIGQDNVQVSWKPNQAFGPNATLNKGLDYQWSSSSPKYGNLAGLLLPVAHIVASYHLPQVTDYVLRQDKKRSAVQNIASFLLRNGNVQIADNKTVQLSCGVATQAPQLKNFVQCLAAEMVVQRLP